MYGPTHIGRKGRLRLSPSKELGEVFVVKEVMKGKPRGRVVVTLVSSIFFTLAPWNNPEIVNVPKFTCTRIQIHVLDPFSGVYLY